MHELTLALESEGTTGLKQSGGFILEEFLKQLQGARAVELLKEMTWNSPQAGAVRVLIHTLSRQVRWKVELAEKPIDPEQAEAAQRLVETSMMDMDHSWHDFVSESLSHVDYGWSYHEVIYKLRKGPGRIEQVRSDYNDGLWGWRRIELRSQDSLDRWEFGEDGTLIGMWQRDPYAPKGGSYKLIKCGRAVHFRTEKFKNNPEGRSVFRNAVIPYLRLKHFEDVEAIGVERDLAGIPFMQAPPEILASNATADHLAIRRQLEKQLGQIKRDQREYILMPAEVNKDGKPTGYKFQLLASSGTRQVNIVETKRECKTDILMSVLAQFLQLGVQSATGSRSLASSSTDLFTLSLGALLDNMQETINHQLVGPLCALNKIDVDNRPKLCHGDIETMPADELGAILNTLFTTGLLTPTEALKKRVYDLVRLPYQAIEQTMPGQQGASGVKTAEELIAEAMVLPSPPALDVTGAASSIPLAGGLPSVTPPALLNKSQVASLLQVIDVVAAGTLPEASARALLMASLGLDDAQVDSILKPIVEQLRERGPVSVVERPGAGGSPK